MWQSKTLKQIVPEAFDAAEVVQIEAQTGLDKLNPALAAVQNALHEANTALNLIQQDINELSETGFAIITLSPKQGSWINRLVTAPNAPSTNSSLYSCGYFNIASMTTEAAAIAVYNAMTKALTEKMEIKPIEPALPAPFAKKADITPGLPIDQWEGLTFGELMPGVFNAVQTAWNNAKAVVNNLQNTKDQVTKKIAQFQAALSKANALISALSTSGIYQYQMEPAIGSWISRAVNEANAPSTISTQYSFGFAAVAVAADLAGAQALYAKLQAVM